jgi:competence protein ComEA
MLSLIACSCEGCGRPEREAFTQTVYAGENTDRNLTGGERSTVSGSGESENDIGSGAQEGMSGAQTLQDHCGPAPDKICVFVCGAVNCEGVYELRENSRVIDAVAAAGGYSEDADTSYVNQAEYVFDTQRIQIPTVEEATVLREAAAKGNVPDK